MYNIIISIVIILILIVLNGLLSMSEIAVVSSRKAKLHRMLNDGKSKAQIVLDFLDDPNPFLSSIQIGITLIGILTGAFGGATLSSPLAEVLDPYIPYAGLISVIIVVLVTTYLTLVGDIAPKMMALNNPEKTAIKLAKPTKILCDVCMPINALLESSTNLVLKLFGSKRTVEATVTEEEIELMIEEGRAEGTIEEEEQAIIKRVFKLDDQKVDMIMTPRSEIIWLDLDDSAEENYEKIIESKRSIFPVAHEELDDFIGVVQAKDILAVLFKEDEIDIKKIVKDPIVVPANLESLELLKEYKENKEYVHMALIVDEFGTVIGLVTLNDLLEGIVGDIPGIDEDDDPIANKRLDGSWLIDGRYQIDRFKELFDIEEEFPEEKEDNYTTIAGFVLSYLNRIPEDGEVFEWENFTFEIADIDSHQIDKIIVRYEENDRD